MTDRDRLKLAQDVIDEAETADRMTSPHMNSSVDRRELALARALQHCEREREQLLESEAEWQRRGDRAIAAEQRVKELERVLSQIAGGFITPSKGERNLRDVAKAALAASPPPEEQDG